MKYLLAVSCAIICFSGYSQLIKPGQWQGEIHYSDASIPFTFEVGYPTDEVPEITLINGKERRVISNSTIEGDSISIPLDPFDVEIRAKFSAMDMRGNYLKHYRNASRSFSAAFGKPRMMKKSVRPSPVIEERWAITFSPSSSGMSRGVGLFKQKGNVVSGTIMTEVSDYRYFEGILDGDSIKLSCFDGAHAFGFYGKWSPDAGWAGMMIYDDGYAEPWTATYDKEAELKDPFEMVEVEPGKEKPYYDLLGAGEGKDAIDPLKYDGQVLIIQLFGTWCPNSHDQTTYLVNWYEKNKARDVAILASSFEANYSQEYGLERLDDYKEMNGIPYDMVLGGRLSKTGAAMPFPFMKRIEAFPTLVILDKQGYVRYVHSYFNGPATGEYYQAFDRRFNEIVDQLLAE
ncbi:AhpC/TSA family protein [Ekhidna lutea]|uniref:AhpC/TSA family protein n=1 Tax=Ekhidna lutea TaxID=447679 RepID=A0A239M7Q6_EKHLU|nr:TlpA disulfide reductase family protein [Ekhidna lutea]SNT38074.1 AhpC/TSA family protein [Ekhidna lutea]